MPPDHNQHSRRPHYHRGRRGQDRRGPDRRPAQQAAEAPAREHLDIEQLMRDIRSRIVDRSGVELTNQQIQELAARRLEAILDPRAIKPSLMDELRRASGLPADAPAPDVQARDEFDEASLYESPNGLVRLMRRLLNPLLRLMINPEAIGRAFNAQAALNKAAAAREADLRRRHTEWNALHFEILRRLVLDITRTEIDAQHLGQRVESLAAKVDFNERRVRGMEQSSLLSKPAGRATEPQQSSPAVAVPRDEAAPHGGSPVPGEGSGDGGRRRRRRRRGRRPGTGPLPEGAGAPGTGTANASSAEPGDEIDDGGNHSGQMEVEDAGVSAAPIMSETPAPAVDSHLPHDPAPSVGERQDSRPVERDPESRSDV